MRDFAIRLKGLRKKHSLTILELSARTGLNTASLSRWENGVYDIKGDQLIVLAEFFGVTVGYLLGTES
ncbi:MAG: helix-turn-helix domain-containing protein [Firmicutes bacterium]|nr:helix-turn-helix domain-containing protein [Bacillota bacterium]